MHANIPNLVGGAALAVPRLPMTNTINFAETLDVQVEYLARLLPLIRRIDSFFSKEESRERPNLRTQNTVLRHRPRCSAIA